MEVTAFCIRLLLNGLLLLDACGHHSYAPTGAVRVVPSRLQLFEYEPVSFTCEGFNVSAGWKVRNIKELIPKCSNDIVATTMTCTIDFALPSDSGEYWCESGGGERSNTVSITVTAGDVILESPVLPVMEGDAVTLRCTKKETPSNITADFYKDGLRVGTTSTGFMTIHGVSVSDDGLYKCHISGAGESPESRLAVINHSFTEQNEKALHRETCLCSDHFGLLLLHLRTVFTIVMVALLLLLVGLLHCGKLRVTHE